MKKETFVALVCIVSICAQGSGQTNRRTRRHKPASSARVAKPKSDVIEAAEDYKRSLERLLVFQENDVKEATAIVEQRKAYYEQNRISLKEVEDSEAALEQAKEKVKNTRREIAYAELIQKSAASDLAIISRGRPYRREVLLKVLRLDALPLQEIIAAIQGRGVDFRLTPECEAEFAAAGASREMLKAMANNYRGQ